MSTNNGKHYYDDEEVTVNPHNKKKEDKFNKHTEVIYSGAELNALGRKLKDTKIDNKVIFGYVALDDKGNEVNCKYNKNTEIFVTYNDNICKACIKDWRTFTCDKAVDYMGEIKE